MSAKVARLEHRAILESLEEVEALAPGLYQMKILNPTGDPDCHKPQYTVAFEDRNVEDLRFDYPRPEFERARAVSESIETAYRTFVSPFVRSAASPWLAEALKWGHPMRVSRYVFSERVVPAMNAVAVAAALTRASRRPCAEDSPFRHLEHGAIEAVTRTIEALTGLRDSAAEALFETFYGGPER